MNLVKVLYRAICVILTTNAFGYSEYGPSVVYIAKDCTGVTTGMCGDPNYHNCSSSSSSYAPTGTYASFSICAAVNVTGKTNKMVVCFQSAMDCFAVWRCGQYASDTGYAGTTPALNVGSNNSVSGAPVGVQNGKAFGCCVNCRVLDWTDVDGENYQKRQARTCNTSNSCGTWQSGQNQYRCKKNYYDARGVGSATGGAGSLDCQPCPDPTEEKAAQTNNAGGAAPYYNCYLPANTALNEADGTYQFVDNVCYYKP